MVQSMPCGVFKWIEPEDFKLENDTNNSKEGHILEVDLEYPKELHDLHNEYPYCPEHIAVKPEMLSEYCRVVGDKNSVKCGKLTKLIPTLYKKEKYIIHERNLKQAVDAGLVLKKIHRVLEFEQKPWMKEYIDFNTEIRKLAMNDFEKNFFKLMNNSVFGKTMENVRKRRNFKLICDENKLEKYISKPTFLNGIKFNTEYANSNIREFIGLRSKMYSIKIDDENEEKKAKGIVKSAIKKDLKHEMYNKILITSGKMYSRMKVIRSQKHRVYTMDINKISLSAYDDKDICYKMG